MAVRKWFTAAGALVLACSGTDRDGVMDGEAWGDPNDSTAGSADTDAVEPTSSSASASGASASATGPADDTSGDDGPKFDIGSDGDAGASGACEQQCGFSDWSYIWIANSSEHTISKIDTRTLVEEGRYRTRPDGSGNPSRTSVSIDGRAVAVANRMGGITKIWARTEFCEDKNNDGVIQTSSGGGDVLPFAQEECVAWHTPFPEATTQRPIAWTSGVYNSTTCEYEDQKIWTAAGNGTGGTWPCTGTNGIYVYRLDGETGIVEDTIHAADVSCGTSFGPYGAAVDFNNDLWMYIWATGTIMHVDYDTLDYQTFSGGSYGITVDTNGRVWSDAGSRYDPVAGTWAQKQGNLPGSGGSGVVQDLQGRIWTATTAGVGWIDMDTMQVGDTVVLPEGSGIYRGIAVDVDGYIWSILLGGNTAHKIDPVTYDVETFTGLNGPYTYSDMSGGQLSNVTCNPPAG